MPAPGSPNAAHAEHSIRGNDTSSVPDEFIYSLKPIYTSYFTLQEQLAADDFSKSLDAIHDLNTALSFVTETGLVGDSRGTWRSIRHMLKVETPPQNIDAARVRFESMSQAIIDLQRQFGHFGSDTWHIAYCPMAFDDKERGMAPA